MNVGSGVPVKADVATELRAFRELLADTHASGGLDQQTYEAARKELDLADKSPGSPEVVLPLKRLRGLIADLPELAAKIAAVIAAVVGS